MIVIADDIKLVAKLGRFPLPVEVMRVRPRHDRRAHRACAAPSSATSTCPVTLRMNGRRARSQTDNGNLIYDCALGAIADRGRTRHARSPTFRAWSSMGCSSASPRRF